VDAVAWIAQVQRLLHLNRGLPGECVHDLSTVRHLRYSARLLFKAPGFTITAVLILGFGIGANTAVFSLIEAVILNAMSYPKSDRLVRVYQPRVKDTKLDISEEYLDYPDYVDLCREQWSFENLCLCLWDFLDLSEQRYPERLTRICASPSLFK
jgi:putative ABC transport system permease protein